MSKIKPNKLLDANTAVESYLDNLLQEATVPNEEQNLSASAYTKKHNVHILATPLTQTHLIDEVVHNESAMETTENISEETLIDEQKEPAQAVFAKENIAFPVQCLMFKVNDNLLAIPIIKMGSVVPFEGRLTQLPHSPKYFKGILKHRDTNVQVADSLSILWKEKNRDENEVFSPSHLLVFENEDWAISCDELLDVVTLNEDDVKWHSGMTGRLSLGTIKKSLALILNPDAISNELSGLEVINKKK